nr:cytochrome P450 307a1-like [Onthophagus taurus]
MVTLNPAFSIISVLLFVVFVVFVATRRRKSKEITASLSSSSILYVEEEESDLKEPKSPISLPIIGHLHLLGGYEVPYQAFSEIGKKYGDVARLKLGGVRSIVVNGAFNVKEVLVTKGHHFDSRPDFKRYQLLFSGNKQNSLAFSDWSYLQKSRRDMLKSFAFPRAFTHKFYSLESIIIDQTQILIKQLESGKNAKKIILHTCANIFTNHFCSKDFKIDDFDFTKMIENFDDVFYEVNQGYAADFLPFLLPFHTKRLKHMNDLTHYIRNFILENVICERFENFGVEDEPIDYVESLIKQVKFGGEPELKWDTALFALEDIIGGHSAIGNFLLKMLGYLVNEIDVQKKIQEEIDFATNTGNKNKFRKVSISDRNLMPYTESAILEAIRLIASPIVPRVANQDSSINGYRIKKGDTLFLNNYDVSMSEELWEVPKKFVPERFLINNKLSKPEFFLPFGGGRRGCMGYRMVQLVSLGILTTILQNYTILPLPSHNYKVKVGSLALPKKTYEFKFEKRNITII